MEIYIVINEIGFQYIGKLTSIWGEIFLITMC